MSFFTLLLLLSLILIVPIFFVIKEKSKQTQLAATQRHQAYLAAASLQHTQTQMAAKEKTTNEHRHEHKQGINVIHFSATHPFVKRLYDEQVPHMFRATMDDIGQQYESTHHDQITESQLFTLNKLIETRVPELIADYLSLDPHYAKTVIIDKDKQNTSYDMVLEQLHSILDFSQKLNTQSQSGVVDKLLASRRYLDDVYKESGMTTDSLDIK